MSKTVRMAKSMQKTWEDVKKYANDKKCSNTENYAIMKSYTNSLWNYTDVFW